MIDKKLLGIDPDYRKRIEAKRVDPKLLDEFIELDEKRSVLLIEVEEKRSLRNTISKEIGKADPEERESKLKVAGEMKVELEGLESQLGDLETKHRERLLQIPCWR